jgi:4-hydroxyphenylpyruvate dioxygenase-like putative hemolysin
LGIAGPCFDSAHPAFNLQFQVRRASLVSAEAELEGVRQVFQPETIGTSLVASVQKRAMRNGFGHSAFPAMYRRKAATGVKRGIIYRPLR